MTKAATADTQEEEEKVKEATVGTVAANEISISMQFIGALLAPIVSLELLLAG